MLRRVTKYKGSFFFILALLLCLTLAGCGAAAGPPSSMPPAGASKDEGGMTVHFIDVGQGDSTLIESGGHYLLIDGGNNDQEKVVTDYLKNQGVSRLDYLILTHPDADHAGGIDAVLKSFDVDKFIMPPVSHTTKTFEDVLDAAAENDVKLTKPVVGTTYQLGDAAFTIIAPNSDYGNDLNNWSVGIKITNGSNSFVLCGDAETEAEHDMVNNGMDLSADVLKLGHHGSSTSSSEEFLDAVGPSAAVISCGKDNSYGHPHRETLEKLKQRGITAYRTDLSGTITAFCDGSRITWSTGKAGGNVSENNPPLTQAATPASENQTEQADHRDTLEQDYVLNTNTKKFHLLSCPSASQTKQSNKEEFHGLRQDLIDQGYTPCQNCNP